MLRDRLAVSAGFTTKCTSTDETQTPLDAYRCPSDDGGETIVAWGLQYGRSNYLGVYGPTPISDASIVVPSAGGGAFGRDSRRRFGDFTDGHYPLHFALN